MYFLGDTTGRPLMAVLKAGRGLHLGWCEIFVGNIRIEQPGERNET